MNKLFFLALLVSTPLFAQHFDAPISNADTPSMTTEMPDVRKKHNPREGHWVTSFGFEGLKYDVPFEFNGDKNDFTPGQQELWGGRVGLGKEFYLGAGFNTTTKVESFYVGTLFSRVLNAGPNDEAIKYATIKRTGSLWGFEASQSIGFLFDMKTKNPFLEEWTYLTVEPFIEAGIGRAWAYNRLAYDYTTTVNEGYRHRVRDELANVKFGGGFNFTSSSGYFLYLKAFVNNFDILERRTTVYERPNGQSGSTDTDIQKNVKIDPITTYMLGGGYKF